MSLCHSAYINHIRLTDANMFNIKIEDNQNHSDLAGKILLVSVTSQYQWCNS